MRNTRADWAVVPRLVAHRFKVATWLQHCLQNNDCDAVWSTADNAVFIKQAEADLCRVNLQAFPSMFQVVLEPSLRDLPGPGGYVVLKQAELSPLGEAATAVTNPIKNTMKATPLSSLGAIHRGVGSALGGQSALTNGLVSGAIGAGTGYLAGSLMSNLLPEEYVKRKNLAKAFALAGGLGGAALHVPEWLGNMSLNHQSSTDANVRAAEAAPDLKDGTRPKPAPGSFNPLQALIRPAAEQPAAKDQALLDWYAYRYGGQHNGDVLHKAGADTGIGNYPISVDRFNNAIWADTHRGDTPPVVAAANTGLITGVQQMYGGSSILSPRHFINGLAAAGVDGVTARVVGSTLGALGILTPRAQTALQTAGIWGGLMRGVSQSVFGL